MSRYLIQFSRIFMPKLFVVPIDVDTSLQVITRCCQTCRSFRCWPDPLGGWHVRMEQDNYLARRGEELQWPEAISVMRRWQLLRKATPAGHVTNASNSNLMLILWAEHGRCWDARMSQRTTCPIVQRPSAETVMQHAEFLGMFNPETERTYWLIHLVLCFFLLCRFTCIHIHIHIYIRT